MEDVNVESGSGDYFIKCKSTLWWDLRVSSQHGPSYVTLEPLYIFLSLYSAFTFHVHPRGINIKLRRF